MRFITDCNRFITDSNRFITDSLRIDFGVYAEVYVGGICGDICVGVRLVDEMVPYGYRYDADKVPS